MARRAIAVRQQVGRRDEFDSGSRPMTRCPAWTRRASCGRFMPHDVRVFKDKFNQCLTNASLPLENRCLKWEAAFLPALRRCLSYGLISLRPAIRPGSIAFSPHHETVLPII